MNKLVIFIIGVVCGFALSRVSADRPILETALENRSEAEEPNVTSEHSASAKIPVIHHSDSTTVAPLAVAPQTPLEDSREKPKPPHPINFVFNEETLETMEQNIVILQKEVSVIKDRDGWVVHFHSPDNLLSQIGLSDNDMIRFNQLDEMRLNPDTQDLAMRMESVLANLER
ncbi:MAG: hypothetical protein ACM3MG_00175 [Bacillota bacterium]